MRQLEMDQAQLDIDQATVASGELSDALTIAELTVDHPCLACKEVHAPYQCPTFKGFDEETQKALFYGLARQAREKARNTSDFPKGGRK